MRDRAPLSSLRCAAAGPTAHSTYDGNDDDTTHRGGSGDLRRGWISVCRRMSIPCVSCARSSAQADSRPASMRPASGFRTGRSARLEGGTVLRLPRPGTVLSVSLVPRRRPGSENPVGRSSRYRVSRRYCHGPTHGARLMTGCSRRASLTTRVDCFPASSPWRHWKNWDCLTLPE